MLTRLLLSVFFSLSILGLQAQSFTFPENENNEGLQILSSKQESIKLNYAIHKFNLEDVTINGENMLRLEHGLNLIPGKSGAPELPYIAAKVLIPQGATANFVILSAEKEVYSNIELSPAAAIPFDTQEDLPIVKGSEYSLNSFFPTQTLQIEQTEVRGMNIANIGISPFQYNPVTKELIAYKNMDLEIQISNASGSYGEDRFRSPFWDQILSDLVINSQDIPKIDYQKRQTNSKDAGCEYLIITLDHEDFISWADTIKKFRNEQGIHTKVMTIDEIGGNDINAIDDFFEDVYDNWDPVPSAVLLLADYAEDGTGITSKMRVHPYDGEYISDNDYADVTGNNLPDFVFARMTSRNAEELEVMINKFTNYERNPPELESFYNNPITALGWQTVRWFQICSETIGGYMSSALGKTPVRINEVYEGNPDVDPWSTASNTYSVLNYFGVNGLNYIPATPGELGDWEGGSAGDITNAINAGAFILQHRDHGFYSGWGEPAYQTANISSLNNVDLLTHVFSINCQTGQFDVGSNSFGEKFHRYADGGALSVTCPTQVSYSFVNDALVWGIYDNMWPDFMPDYGGNLIPERDFRPAFGLASGKYFLSSNNWANANLKTITYRLFHHFGDAFNIVYTEMPQDNPVAYETTLTNDITTISVQGAPYSLVGLSIDGNFISSGTCDDTGNLNLDFPMQDPGTLMKIVITKQNYFRYEGTIMVIPAEGPYVVETSCVINDITANNNGIIEYNENISLDFTVKNIGIELAENVVISLSTNDEFIVLTDNSETIGDMASGEVITINEAFAFTVPVNIPDQHNIEFVFSATNGIDTWESDLILKANAPNLEFTIISFEETSGNGNGYLDPGETAIASFEALNNGHVEFPAGSLTLSPNSSYITIESDVQIFDLIGIDESLVSSFEITTTSSTPPSTAASITSLITADPFDLSREMYFNIGLVVEDWELADFNKFAWELEGDKDWEIAEDHVEEGDYSVKIGDLGDAEAASISLDYNVISDHEISFYAQVSTEDKHDFLSFYIDDELIASWSGLLLFEQFAFPINEGIHTFKWEYIKDAEGDSGLDAAWLDFIILPPGNTILATSDISMNDDFVKIFPNPANNYLNLKSKNDNLIEYYIINAQGQVIISDILKSERQINISKLNEGLYIIKLQNSDGNQQIHQFIKM